MTSPQLAMGRLRSKYQAQRPEPPENRQPEIRPKQIFKSIEPTKANDFYNLIIRTGFHYVPTDILQLKLTGTSFASSSGHIRPDESFESNFSSRTTEK